MSMVYTPLKGLTTYLYRGYNPVTKYHGHPSTFSIIDFLVSVLNFRDVLDVV